MTVLTQIQKEKSADLILDYLKMGGEKALQETIDKLDLVTNPHLATPTGSATIRDKVKFLIQDYISGSGKLGLEETINEISKVLQSTIKLNKTINLMPTTTQKPLLTNKSYSNSSRFTQNQINVLNLSTITTLQFFNYVLESVIDERCIYKVDFFISTQGNHSYNAEFTDVGKNMILFQYTSSIGNRGLSPAEIVLGVLKSFYDSHSTKGVLKYDHLTGKIEVL